MNEDKSNTRDRHEAVPSPVQSPSNQGVFSVKKPKKSRKRLVIAAAIIVLGLGGAGIWWWLSQGSTAPKASKESGNQPVLATVCDTATIQSAGKPISENNIEALQSIADSVLHKKNYKGDVNCNYILMRYYLMTGDVVNAKSTLDDLFDTHGRSGGYSTAFDPPAMSPASLRDTLEVMVANNQAEQKQNDELNGLDG